MLAGSGTASTASSIAARSVEFIGTEAISDSNAPSGAPCCW